jgi:hypothetical protein
MDNKKKMIKKLIIAGAIILTAIVPATYYFSQAEDLSGNCTSTQCVNHYQWKTIGGVKYCVAC